MPSVPSPEQLYDEAAHEGSRRLFMPLLEQASVGFIAGMTIVSGIVAPGVTQALAEPAVGPEAAKIVGALAFAIGLVFLVVGRSELFTNNSFDPVAAASDQKDGSPWLRLIRLWGVILVLNLVDGAVLTAVVSVEGALPASSHRSTGEVAEEIADGAPPRRWPAPSSRELC